MTRGEGACLVCGKPIVYYGKAKEMECVVCHRKFMSHASCEDGHYVCDECHEKKGVEVIMEGCRRSASRNPIKIMQGLMENPYIYMHGPEHHIMVGAALLTAFYNSGGYVGDKGKDEQSDSAFSGVIEEETDCQHALPGREQYLAALEEMKSRGSEYPGGACGLWGCCGAAVSTGIFMSIITKATPLTGKSWKLSNRMTSKALGAIAELGGPRCCKRDSFTAAKEAVLFVKENLGIEMELPDEIRCDFSDENRECLRKYCPYHRN